MDLVLLDAMGTRPYRGLTSMASQFPDVRVRAWDKKVSRFTVAQTGDAGQAAVTARTKKSMPFLSNAKLFLGLIWTTLPLEWLSRREVTARVFRRYLKLRPQEQRGLYGVTPLIHATLCHPRLAIYARRIRCFVSELEPDLVISFMSKPTIAASLALMDSNLPLVASERNDLEQNGTPRPILLALPTAWSRCELVTANLKETTSFIAELSPEVPCKWLPNRFPTEEAEQEGAECMDNLLMVTRLERQKGVEMVIRSLLEPALERRKTVLHVVGDGTERKRLESLTERLGLHSRVQFHGVLPGFHLSLLEESIGFIISNSLYEGSSNSLHEGVAKGLVPIFNTRVREVRQILHPRLWSQCSFAGDSSSLSQAIGNFLDQPAHRRKIGAQVRLAFKRFWVSAEDERARVIAELLEIARRTDNS